MATDISGWFRDGRWATSSTTGESAEETTESRQRGRWATTSTTGESAQTPRHRRWATTSTTGESAEGAVEATTGEGAGSTIREKHRERLAPYVQPHLARRRAGIAHPVHDFLFTYYSFSPAKLLDWQPGWPSSGTPELLAKRRRLVASTLDLLRATAGRAATFACFGLHEWAMVHRADETRHQAPLRLGPSGTDSVVESHRITCSHFDAYRFFTPTAAPLNQLRPGPNDRATYEQPGCLHATMDLYKHAFRLWPLVGSDLVADCFELAWDVRIVDMRAAPYDLSGTTLDPTGEPWTPIRIESPAGKQQYAAMQRRFADRAEPLRARLIQHCEQLILRD